MARHRRLKVLSTMEQVGLIPVFYNKDIETAKKKLSAPAQKAAQSVLK